MMMDAEVEGQRDGWRKVGDTDACFSGEDTTTNCRRGQEHLVEEADHVAV